MNKSMGWQLYEKARTLIPGGTQLLSKRPEMFLPEHWPCYYHSAQGAEITDLDGNTYIDMSICGVGSTVLGYADPDVDGAVKATIDKGSMSTLNCPEEVELAETLIELHPWADMARFSRSGGEAMAIAIRIARAFSKRDHVAFCGYHGWHDWYLSANLGGGSELDGHLLPGLDPAGVPQSLNGLMHPFTYNQIDELEKIITVHGNNLGAIVMEPTRSEQPAEGFLERVRELADKCGAVLIFDEITTGFRINSGGIHLNYSVNPDIAVFAKAIGNGYPISAIIGIQEVMQAAQTSFISSTSWTERIGPTAALATIKKFRANNVHDHLQNIGGKIRKTIINAGDKHNIPLSVSGIAPLTHFTFNIDNAELARTLFTQLMLDNKILAGSSFYAMYAHNEESVTSYAKAIDKAFGEIADYIKQGTLKKALKGPVAHSGFKRLA